MIKNLLRYIKRQYRIFKSIAALIYYGFPSRTIKLIGVTGTSGKSTTAFLVYTLLKNCGYKTGVISTVGAFIGSKSIDTGLHVTTPDPIELVRLLSTMKKEGAKFIVIEASSHALEQGRLGILRFEYAVFTNIKRDHFDYHKTWDNYALSKARLISRLKRKGKTIINKDDYNSLTFLQKYKVPKIFYSKYQEVSKIKFSNTGITFEYKGTNFSLNILGEYNIENALAAIKILEEMNVSLKEISKALSSFKGLEGRMEIIYNGQFTAIVDFAHNTDSLIQSLNSAKTLSANGRIITVFGSAGLRDKEKRFEMGKASGEIADITVVTAEDPRTEKLYNINSEIIKGAESSGAVLIKRFSNTEEYLQFISGLEFAKIKKEGKKFIFAFDMEDIQSRINAIEFALRLAQKGDIVITEGKGHEQSLCFGTIEYPFTDKSALTSGLKNLGLTK